MTDRIRGSHLLEVDKQSKRKRTVIFSLSSLHMLLSNDTVCFGLLVFPPSLQQFALRSVAHTKDTNDEKIKSYLQGCNSLRFSLHNNHFNKKENWHHSVWYYPIIIIGHYNRMKTGVLNGRLHHTRGSIKILAQNRQKWRSFIAALLASRHIRE